MFIGPWSVQRPSQVKGNFLLEIWDGYFFLQTFWYCEFDTFNCPRLPFAFTVPCLIILFKVLVKPVSSEACLTFPWHVQPYGIRCVYELLVSIFPITFLCTCTCYPWRLDVLTGSALSTSPSNYFAVIWYVCNAIVLR